ncbi:hypothetical protein JCM5350_002260 [Sporobolomyces pararoseus]
MESFGDLNIFRLPISERIESLTHAIKAEQVEDESLDGSDDVEVKAQLEAVKEEKEKPFVTEEVEDESLDVFDDAEVKEELEEVKEEDEELFVPSVPELTTIDFMWDIDEEARQTEPKEPHTTKFPDFPPLPFKRRAPHPLVRDTWFDSKLSLPPPAHLHTLDDGNSLFDVNFARYPDIGGEPQRMVSRLARDLCCAGWHMPVDRAEGGGPYYILSSSAWKEDWDKVGKIAALGTPEGYAQAVLERLKKKKPQQPPVEVCDGSVSLFYGGGGKHTNSWRYRGDVKVHKQIDILPSDFAAMKPEEKSQWLDYFRFENVVFRLDGTDKDKDENVIRVWSPAELWEYLSAPTPALEDKKPLQKRKRKH